MIKLVVKAKQAEQFLNMDQLKLLNKRSVLIGGTAIALMVGPERVSNPLYPKSSDIDVIMRNSELVELRGKLRQKYIREYLVDTERTKMCGMGREPIVKIEYKPFFLNRFPDSQIDIFTPRTGVGPINIDNSVLRNVVEYTYHGLKLNVAHISFMIATTIHPLAATDYRIFRTSLIICDFALKNGEKALIEDALKPAAAYVKDSSSVVKGTLEKIKEDDEMRRKFSHIFKRKDYIEYDRYFSETIPCRISTNRSKIARFVSQIGIGNKTENSDILNSLEKFLRTV